MDPHNPEEIADFITPDQHLMCPYIPSQIRPCTLDGGKASPFHLLSCGHIVIRTGADIRCGCNCSHVSQPQGQSRPAPPGPAFGWIPAPQDPTPAHLPEETQLQSQATLVCELCTGLPAAYISRVQPYVPGRERVPAHTTHALTRPMLKVLLGVPNDVVMEQMLCHIAYADPYALFSDYAHRLRCGHEVRFPILQCGANCSVDPPCRGDAARNTGEAIVCRECTLRTEHIYHRFRRAGASS